MVRSAEARAAGQGRRSEKVLRRGHEAAEPGGENYLLLILFTGLRRSEAASLTWDDVDFAARILRVKASATKARRKLDLPMSSFVFDLLEARRMIGDTNWIFPAGSESGHISEPKFPLALIKARPGSRSAFTTYAELLSQLLKAPT